MEFGVLYKKKISKMNEDIPSTQSILKIMEEYETADIYRKLQMKIDHKQELQDLSWPIIKDKKEYEYSFNKFLNGNVYYYCRAYRSGCKTPSLTIDLLNKKVTF